MQVYELLLEERIMPRHKVLVENRINFTLQSMLAITDEEFNERVDAELQDRESFEAGGALLESEHDKLMDRMQVGLESSEIINDDWSSSNEMSDIGIVIIDSVTVLATVYLSLFCFN
ncbi:hypothetical protein Droror1_Dr00027535 [Drosera rotundifolia]